MNYAVKLSIGYQFCYKIIIIASQQAMMTSSSGSTNDINNIEITLTQFSCVTHILVFWVSNLQIMVCRYFEIIKWY